MVVHLGECDRLASTYVWCECPSFGFMYRPIVPTDSARVGVGGARRAVGVGGARRSRRAHAWSAREVSLFVSRAPALKRTGTAS